MRRLPLRWRWALVCAALVTGTGVLVVVLSLRITASELRSRNRELGPLPAAGAPPPGPAGANPGDIRPAQGRIADEVIADAQRTGLVVVGVLAVASLGIGWVVAGRMVRPLAEISKVADEVAGGRLGERIGATDGPRDELTRLARSFDDMLDRLDRAFDAQRAFVADASHELRTPLAVMRTEIDVALDDPDADAASLRAALAATSDALDRGIRLVESLLALSRSETLVDVGDVDLAALASGALAGHPAGGRRLDVDLEPAVVRGDPILLDRLVANLVDNAFRHSPDDATVQVRTGTDEGRSDLVVESSGAELTVDEVAALQRRFARGRPAGGDPTRGSGVGLAVVAAIARTHGAILELRPADGGGLRAEVRFAAAG